ncbi:unnamed protein product [Nesidiocoris tenuis]|uniref:Uncharacterized protein n=1 Tax=Nesidiocoris tenuis TaxID=355587 RepID=A0A6H5G9B5_9HEMI|nr:unnamed protein product [Nesidiocoris tenuis]
MFFGKTPYRMVSQAGNPGKMLKIQVHGITSKIGHFWKKCADDVESAKSDFLDKRYSSDSHFRRAHSTSFSRYTFSRESQFSSRTDATLQSSRYFNSKGHTKFKKKVIARERVQ